MGKEQLRLNLKVLEIMTQSICELKFSQLVFFALGCLLLELGIGIDSLPSSPSGVACTNPSFLFLFGAAVSF